MTLASLADIGVCGNRRKAHRPQEGARKGGGHDCLGKVPGAPTPFPTLTLTLTFTFILTLTPTLALALALLLLLLLLLPLLFLLLFRPPMLKYEHGTLRR